MALITSLQWHLYRRGIHQVASKQSADVLEAGTNGQAYKSEGHIAMARRLGQSVEGKAGLVRFSQYAVVSTF